MKRRCYERGAEDNLTAVLVRVGGGGGGGRSAAAAADDDDEKTLIRERADLHAAGALSDASPPLLRRPFDSAGAAVATAEPARARARAAGAAAENEETSTAVGGSSNVRAPERKSGRGLLTFGVLLLTLGAAVLAFYMGIMFERRGMSKQVGLAGDAATPAPTATAVATPAESPADRFGRLRRAVDLSPATEAARMSAEANGHPLESPDPEFLYLYGRALLLTDRQPEAAAAFDRVIERAAENMTPVNGELKIDARLAKVAAHLRGRDEQAARAAAEALSEVVRPQQPQPVATEAGTAPTPVP